MVLMSLRLIMEVSQGRWTPDDRCIATAYHWVATISSACAAIHPCINGRDHASSHGCLTLPRWKDDRAQPVRRIAPSHILLAIVNPV